MPGGARSAPARSTTTLHQPADHGARGARPPPRAHDRRLHPDLAYDIIIDWDGTLLTCRNDFGRKAALGSVAEAPLTALLADERRRLLHRRLRDRDWNAIGICRSCLFDDPAATRDAAAAG